MIVMKFGGTSVADIDRIRNVANHVKREVDAGNKVLPSVLAGKKSPTDGLNQLNTAWQNLSPDKRGPDYA